MFDQSGKQRVMIPKGLNPDNYCAEKGWTRVSRITYSLDYWQEFVVTEDNELEDECLIPKNE